ncbi:3-deoxy-D-manno-octulosonic-acid transferase [Robiginitalea myxolifaciens]|uniref:3-deoxy-D-manno-octulosonic acid transferase n=1 Tax=Robiginitalea myxolifaciens TaxID=400055 RepID=A0A1I6FUF9_9FLAO|nr:glycosyltransferase N-terminal domain-containing protein [Robiginitalea myxolifaciens]SFR33570.1 3-deoxy-D-manno-octulosonic-acid transferase [Robiginitalea myxolifaciens]
MVLVYFFYDLAVRLTGFLLHLPALFNQKIRQFLTGRQGVWEYLQTFRQPDKNLIWLHAASLGEFEQGLPVLEHLQKEFPQHQYLVTFFSPSGYEVKKGSMPGVGMTYLPLDTTSAAKRFIQLVKPEIALFVKYEVWPNLYRELHRAGIPNVMISTLFKPGQAYFKWYGGIMRAALKHVVYFYVQDERSAQLLESLGFENHTVCGDTRFDRVLEILDRDNQLDFMEYFKGKRSCLVAGSTWPEDETVLLPLLRELDPANSCAVMAPHAIQPHAIKKLQEKLGPGTICYSEISGKGKDFLKNARILVLDTIGILTKVYSYADLAYVGGGFATGLHNTLEPAVFGIPVIIGPQYSGFREAEQLVALGGIRVVEDPKAAHITLSEYLNSPEKRSETGQINSEFILKSKGASIQIAAGIRKYL